MKIAAIFMYLLFCILYLSIGDSSREWGGFNICTQLGFIGYLSFLMESNKKNTEIERLFFSYIKYLSIANCIYIVWCVFRGSYWSIYHTDVFAYILGICSIIMFLHAGINNGKNDSR